MTRYHFDWRLKDEPPEAQTRPASAVVEREGEVLELQGKYGIVITGLKVSYEPSYNYIPFNHYTDYVSEPLVAI